jgi:ketosteroid isomerase-like protein
MAERGLNTQAELEHFLDCFNRQDVDGIMEYFVDEGVFQTPAGPNADGNAVQGKAAVHAYFTKMFADMPDMHFGQDRHWAMGDFAVSEWLLTGTRQDGTRLETWGTDHFHLRDGRIVLKNTYLKLVR